MTHPLLYELNTRCWLRGLSDKQGRGITLADAPEDEIDSWQNLGFTHVWAMGVWTTGPRCREMALRNASLRQAFSKILPDWAEQDVTGSPYAIEKYEVPATLGGNEGLKKFRSQLNKRGLKLLLDFVPNHLGLDHPWVESRPNLFIQGTGETPGMFQQRAEDGIRWFAHGRDPNFPPWSDTAQVNYRNPEARVAMTEILKNISTQCDGVRCDMAMLLLNDVFAKTWASIPESTPTPTSEFWAEAIPEVRRKLPNFLFLAEVYWGLEATLQSLGFDYTYCKTIYDRLLEHDYAGLQKELLASPADYVNKSVHLLENHDERRIASILSLDEHRAAALLMLGLPGMRFIHEGQLQGARIHVPVQLGRRPNEPVDGAVSAMYEKFLAAIKGSAIGNGDWRMLSPPANGQNVIIIQWQNMGRAFDLVVVNPAPQPVECRIHPVIKELAGHDWRIRELLGNETVHCHGGDLEAQGLPLNLLAYGSKLFRFQAHSN